jgi:hypothetical protein
MTAEKTQENVEKDMVNVEITIFTDWKCEKDDHAGIAKMRIEKSCSMASSLFHLIEISCMNYEEMMLGEVDSKFAHEHFESIRTVAHLGKQLAYQI